MAKTITKYDLLIARNLCRLRKEFKITQRTISKLLGVTFQQFQKYESGSNRISAGKLYELSMSLGVPLDYFFTEK